MFAYNYASDSQRPINEILNSPFKIRMRVEMGGFGTVFVFWKLCLNVAKRSLKVRSLLIKIMNVSVSDNTLRRIKYLQVTFV